MILLLTFTKRYPEVPNFIVQDLPETREAAEAFITSKGLSHKVKFIPQNFFKPQQCEGKRYLFVIQHGKSLSFPKPHDCTQFLP
jgi:hypothetical protein